VSRPAGEVMREAESLVKAGVKELLVISQDTSAYGVDLRYRTDFWGGRPLKTRMHELVAALGELGPSGTGQADQGPDGGTGSSVWVRLHYVYPYPHVDDVIPLMAQGRILPYLDVPFQHANPRILGLMKRPASGEDNLARIRAWRAICPEITIRSRFIAGFPGETEGEFQELLDFLAEAQLDRVGCFAYSPVQGAAANALPRPVPEDVREERRARLMQLQEKISAQRLRARVGKTLRVLVDQVGPQGAVARSAADAPEIDGVVHIEDGAHLKAGEFAQVNVVRSDAHDLWATCEAGSAKPRAARRPKISEISR
jgi:ribosomal protein S12 methylthiotransferase